MTGKEKPKLLQLRAMLPDTDDDLIHLVRSMVRDELAVLAAQDWAPLLPSGPSQTRDAGPNSCD